MPYHTGNEKNSPMGVSKKLSEKQMEKLKEHSKLHKGGMSGKHIKNMVKFMKKGDTFATAHTKAKNIDNESKTKSKPKMETVELDGEKIKFKEGALHKQLKTPAGYTFKRSELNKLKNIENGKTFDFLGKSFKMTPLLKKRISFGLTLMKSK